MSPALDAFAESDFRHGPFIVRSASRSHVGRVRAINEDRVFDDAAAGVWAVVDGMGGHRGGDLAAQTVVDSLRRTVAQRPVTPASIREALIVANALIGERNRRLRLDAGATAVSATLAGDALAVAWAGDSRAYRFCDGGLQQLTRDHSLVQQLVDRGLITPAMAEGHPQANVVTRALGVDADLALDETTVRVTPGAAPARFLLCSDGLSRSLRDEDATIDLSMNALADRLMANALRRDGTDNASLLLIEIAHRR